MRGKATPAQQDGGVIRSQDIVRLIDQVVLSAAPTYYTSEAVQTGPFRRFALYLRTKSSGTPTTVQYIVEFLEEQSGLWHKYAQGPFASLYYEDTDTATEVDECFQGQCLGRAIRVRAVGTGTSASATFTVSASLELRD